MFLRSLFAATALLLMPATATAAPQAAVASGAKKAASKPDIDPAQAMAMMTKVFDRLFPTGPEPEPARLASARDMTMLMFPTGAYAEAMNGFVEGVADRVLDMSEADFVAMMPEAMPVKKDGKAKPLSRVPLRQALAAKEPNFDAKLAAGKAFARTMFVKFGDVAEPRFREGMARSLARKFDGEQLAEINAFLSTPTGAAYGRQMLGMWFEPEVMRGTFQAFPELFKLMPEVMKDAAVFEGQMKGKPSAAEKK